MLTAQNIKDQFVQGVKGAVREFEKNANFQSWMNHPRFREKVAANLTALITKVKGRSL